MYFLKKFPQELYQSKTFPQRETKTMSLKENGPGPPVMTKLIFPIYG